MSKHNPQDAGYWEIPRGTEIPAGWEMEAETSVFGLNETGEFEGSYDDGQGWSFAWKAAWHTGEYVIGQPGTEVVSLHVFHGTWNSGSEQPTADEIQPAVTLNFERHVYRRAVQFEQPQSFSGFDAHGNRRTVTDWWTRGCCQP